MIKVLDAWAVLAWLRGEGAAAKRVRLLLRSAVQKKIRLRLSLINLGEVYYNTAKTIGEARAEAVVKQLRLAPISFVSVSESLVLKAATLKAHFPISYADAFAAATAREENAILVTGDRDFKVLEKERIVSVDWLS